MRGSVKKKGSWGYVVDVGRDSITGRRKQKTKFGFKRQKDAQAALNDVLKEIQTQDYVELSKEIFSSYIDIWYTSHLKKLLHLMINLSTKNIKTRSTKCVTRVEESDYVF